MDQINIIEYSMEGLTKVFILPVTLHLVSEPYHWFSLDFGKVSPVTRPWGRTLDQGEFSMLITNDWLIKKDGKVVANRQYDDYNRLKKLPDALIGSYIRVIKASPDRNRYRIKFANKFELIITNSSDHHRQIFSLNKTPTLNFDLIDTLELPVTKLDLDKHNRLTIEYGKLDQYRLLRNGAEVRRFTKGQYTFKITGEWQIKKAGKVIADSKKINKEKLTEFDDVLLGKHVDEIKISEDACQLRLKYSEQTTLTVKNNSSKLGTKPFISINPNFNGLYYVKKEK